MRVKKKNQNYRIMAAVWFLALAAVSAVLVYAILRGNDVWGRTGEDGNAGQRPGEVRLITLDGLDSDAAGPVTVEQLASERVSGSEIRLVWSDAADERVSAYLVSRRKTSDEIGEWELIASVPSDGTVSGKENSYVDELNDTAPQQFEYRVDVEIPDPESYQAEEGDTVLASNVIICIDPGHYEGSSVLEGENIYGYTEGYFTLKVGLELKRVLKEQYGIDSYMTRESGTITLGGYTDGSLDSGHISLRGEYAADSDLFISLHTNANDEDANGYPTCEQPIAINKTIVIVNEIALQSDIAMCIANSAGSSLSDVNYRLGLSSTEGFATVSSGSVLEWTQDFNDGLAQRGTVCRRQGTNGDYYGVLRGAANVGVPGMIIEHGFHTVAEVRRSAMEDNLYEMWAAADASGIAAGFGFAARTEL